MYIDTFRMSIEMETDNTLPCPVTIDELEMDLDELDVEIIDGLNAKIDKLDAEIEFSFNLLNGLINKSNLTIRQTSLSNELFETLRVIENCASCTTKIIKKMKRKGYIYFNKFTDRFENIVNEIESLFVELEKERKPNVVDEISHKLNEIDDELKRDALCEGCE